MASQWFFFIKILINSDNNMDLLQTSKNQCLLREEEIFLDHKQQKDNFKKIDR